MVFDSSDDVANDDADNVFILDVQVGVGPAGFSAIAPWLSTEIQLPHMNTHPVVMIIILVELMIDVWLWGSSDCRTIWHRTIRHRTIWHQDDKADNLAPR